MVNNSTSGFTDEVLKTDIEHFKAVIQAWAESHHLWFDCGFKDYFDHVDGEPSDEEPVVLIMYYSYGFEPALNGPLEGEFWDLVASHGFHYEDVGYANVYFYPDEGARCVAFVEYMRWTWTCRLIKPDFADIYDELYAHFAARPDDLHRLDWRAYEILLFRIFQAQGYMAELGPGQGDGGVDIKLLQRDPIGDVLTLVQVKKYAPRRKINLEAVAALHGVAQVEKADRSLFITTSSYLPSAKRFASRTSGRLELHATDSVVEWCQSARDGVIRDKSTLVTRSSVERLLLDIKGRPDPRIVHASWGYNMILNNFALIVKETKHAALLMSLANLKLTDDGFGQRGTEMPQLDVSALGMLNADSVWRAKRIIKDNGRVTYWDGRNLYFPWDGKAVNFDYVD